MKTTLVRRDSIIPVIVGGVVIVLAVLGLVIFGLWTLADGWTRTAVNWWAVIATMLIVPGFLAGFWFGKTEVRGFLSGADKMLDRMSGTVERIVAVRDTSRVTVHNATKPAGYTVVLPNVPRSMPTITHRELTSGDNQTEDL
jgi:hypothetical protein